VSSASAATGSPSSCHWLMAALRTAASASSIGRSRQPILSANETMIPSGPRT
jgi:hypothetical protein